MKLILIVMCMATIAACQTTQKKAIVAQPVLTPISEGLTCHISESENILQWYSGNRVPGETQWVAFEPGIVWVSPTPEASYWNCKKGKWELNRAALKENSDRLLLMNQARVDVLTRKLNADEVEVLEGSLLLESYGARSFGPGEFERFKCEEKATITAQLVAQLSFWGPTEAELPLSMMKDYVKGMQCDAGVQRAYEIMNDRIIEWLKVMTKKDK